ncbi:TetR/AcrR family transcriptional regulator [Actinosynnema pretiosum subsp. pretiosum]|uniref:TetR/AcrR family transcriptional regulator n=1 Tax=Actinosynnema pretiosum subsp. pretiosum TaxID=103721 RepID=A0AA45R3H0_9PSEU|nr:Transcriptional regulator, TetR family [Actinosynnema pretiosum subsp. pretiosum]QUF03570.1 TetR/AcrR family transcriptional regulator [Actinosynnema pretiosum subsp. pretiosum]
MVTRAESAAATRRALLDAAAGLLDEGGPDAVTLREVGARAGVTRGAPYRHFPDKDSLLSTIAAEALDRLAAEAGAVRAGSAGSPATRLTGALGVLMSAGRHHPHLYRLMFAHPSGDQAAIEAAAGAAARAEAEFLAAVADLVGPAKAPRFAGLLLTSAHGITTMEANGDPSEAKWGATAEELVATLVAMIERQAREE